MDVDEVQTSDDARIFDVAPPIFDLFSSRMRFLEGRG